MPDPSADRPLPDPKIESFTEEDVRLVAEVHRTADPGNVYVDGWLARAVLSALAAAGRLLPPDAEHREEWTAVLTDRTSGRVTTWKPRPSEEDLRNSLRRLAVDDWDVEVQLHRRAVVFAAGPWVEVENTSEEPDA